MVNKELLCAGVNLRTLPLRSRKKTAEAMLERRNESSKNNEGRSPSVHTILQSEKTDATTKDHIEHEM